MTRQSIEHLWSRLWARRYVAGGARARFTLGGDDYRNIGQQVPRFLQAHRRATAIADALFLGGCTAIVAWNGRPSNPTGLHRRVNTGFAALRSTGFRATQTGAWQAVVYPSPGDEPDVSAVRSYDLGVDKVARDTLLWHAVAAEMPIYPSAPVDIFLLDSDGSAMLYILDDRGADVIAQDAARLQGLVSRFAEWRDV